MTRAIGRAIGGLARRAHHRVSAARVDVQHPHAKISCRSDGASHRVRDVVKLQIEKHAVPAADERADDVRPRGREELAANLDAANCAAKLVRQLDRLGRRCDVERD